MVAGPPPKGHKINLWGHKVNNEIGGGKSYYKLTRYTFILLSFFVKYQIVIRLWT